MKLVYIAGPFRGKNHWEIEQNIRRAEAFALEVWRSGFACICPHANTRFFDGAAEDRVWLEGDIEIMLRCDAVLMTPDWAKSVGATAEYSRAIAEGIPVYHSIADLGALHGSRVSRRRSDAVNVQTMPSAKALEVLFGGPSESLPNSPRQHIYWSPQTCPCEKEKPCNVCDGGLAVCSICGQAEDALGAVCPGPVKAVSGPHYTNPPRKTLGAV